MTASQLEKIAAQAKPTIIIKFSSILGKGYNRFANTRSFYRVVMGSRASKKSKSIALIYIHDILKYKWANLLVMRRYSNTNRQSTFTDLKWAARRLHVSHLFKFNPSLPEIVVKSTGQKIIFRGLDDELKITSISVDSGILSWAWFEEAYQIEDPKKFETVVESIRGSYPDPTFFKQITVSFNPWNSRSWLKRYFFDEKTRYRDVFALRTTFRTNEWLDESDKSHFEQIYRTNPKRARVVCDGNWGVAEGLVYEDNFEVYDFPDDEIRSLPKYYGLDFGFKNDPTAAAFVAVDMEKHNLYIFDEIYSYHMLTRDIFDKLRKHGISSKIIRADYSDSRTIAELKNMGCIGIQQSLKGKNSIQFGISFLQGFKIYVRSKCKNVIDELNLYAYKKDKNGIWTNTPEDANNHYLDALRYAVEPLTFPAKHEINKAKQIQMLNRLGM